uniref:Uncharacterized protein n=1 Tax=Arundo donax TaxID=35708 RepID=A0A0A9FF02_ARUDO
MVFGITLNGLSNYLS